MMMISTSTIYRQYFRYIDPPLVSNAFCGLSRGPVMFTSVVYIENNGIQITNCNFVHRRVHHWQVNRYYFDSISTVLRVDIGYTWVLYLGILPSVVAKLSDLKNSPVFGPPYIDNSVGSQSVTCLLELRLRCTVALYLVCPVYLSYLWSNYYWRSRFGFWVSKHYPRIRTLVCNIVPESTSFDISVTVNRLCMFCAFVYCIWYNEYEFVFIAVCI